MGTPLSMQRRAGTGSSLCSLRERTAWITSRAFHAAIGLEACHRSRMETSCAVASGPTYGLTNVILKRSRAIPAGPAIRRTDGAGPTMVRDMAYAAGKARGSLRPAPSIAALRAPCGAAQPYSNDIQRLRWPSCAAWQGRSRARVTSCRLAAHRYEAPARSSPHPGSRQPESIEGISARLATTA